VPLTPVSPRRPLHWPACLESIRAALSGEPDVYIVGGAVRDAYLHRPLHDIDLASQGDGRPLARRIANAFGGAYYPLDQERGIGRALIDWDGEPITVDVAQFRGPDLLTDLQRRDFTLNAMAVQLTGDLSQVIDPLNGLSDLEAKQLRQCSPESIPSDPVRALRAVRTSITHRLVIEPVTRRSIKEHAHRLAAVSPERVRDELFQILDNQRPATALTALYQLGIVEAVLPEAAAMHAITQGPPHQFDVWRHTLYTIEHLDNILRTIAPQRNPDLAANVQLGTIALALNGLRNPLQTHLAHQWPNGRTHRALLMLAALLHDTGKPATRTTDADGCIRFLNHEQIGAQLATERALALRLSSEETERLALIVRHHMRPHWLHDNDALTARAIYRFWRDTGAAGVDICLLALADYLGTYGASLDARAWASYSESIRALLERYYIHHSPAVAPPPLLTGQILLDRFGLKPGPQIGQILEQLREAQATGEVATNEEALDWVQRFLERSS
jgi:putative nucleotidyltransferase with HDIG domain